MKKTNFVVVFWLVLALIFTVVLLINLAGIFNNLSYIIIPPKDVAAYMSPDDIKRSLLVNVPMGIISLVGMLLSTKKGITTYQEV